MLNVPGTIAISSLDRLRLESTYDHALRERLLSDPSSVLKERGIDVPDGVNVKVVEDTATLHTFNIPPFVGSDSNRAALKAAAQSVTWECTTCTPTSPICAGSLASLVCVTKNC
jgi:hypothetical protein